MPHEPAGASGRTRLGVVAATAVVAAAGAAWIAWAVTTSAPAEAAPSPEFKYLDEDDDAAAAIRERVQDPRLPA